jgi:hypothetical protein
MKCYGVYLDGLRKTNKFNQGRRSSDRDSKRAPLRQQVPIIIINIIIVVKIFVNICRSVLCSSQL